MSWRKKLIAVVGPTGSGKTALGVDLARSYNGIIISADSRQVYSGLDTGTNKEGKATHWQGCPARTSGGIVQLMIDVVSPGAHYTVADWLSAVKALLPAIWSENKVPVIVGGTGLYVNALLEGYVLGGGRYSHQREPVEFDALTMIPDIGRDELYQRSNQRCEYVFDSVVIEVKKHIADKVPADWLLKIGLDYRFATHYVLGQCSRDQAIIDSQQANRAYIRRQLTWWRHHQRPLLVDYRKALDASGKFLKEPKKSVE